MANIKVKAWRIDNTASDYYHVKLKWRTADGKEHSTSKSTKIPKKGNNKRKADAAVEQIRLAKEQELNSKQEPQGQLFSDFMDYWLSVKRRTVRRSTADSYKTCIGCMKPYFDERSITLENIKAADIQGFYNALLDSGRTANTVKHYHANISNALKFALKQGLIEHNPLDAVVLPQIERKDKKSFSSEQIQAILDAIECDPIKTGVYLSLYGGLRRSEVLGLTWDCVDFKNKVIYIRQTRTKVNREIFEHKTKSKTSLRSIPLNDILEKVLRQEKSTQEDNAQLLKSAYDNNNFVCRYADGRPLRCEYLSKHFEIVLMRLGIEGYSYHSIRHTTGSIMVNSGLVGITAVRDYLGHSDVQTTNLYLHADNENKKQALDVFSAIISKN